MARHRPEFPRLERQLALDRLHREQPPRTIYIHAMLNAYWERLTFALPTVSDQGARRWLRWIDTALSSPDDICAWEEAPTVSASRYVVEARSLVLLVERAQ